MKTPQLLFNALLISALIMAGCSNKKDSPHFNTIDELDARAEQVITDMEDLDTARIMTVDRDILATVQQIDMKDPGMKPEHVTAIAEFVKIRRPVSNFFRDYDSKISDLNAYRSELDELAEQWRKDRIDEEQLIEELDRKKEEIEKIDMRTTEDIAKMKEKLQVYDSLAPIVHGLIPGR